MSYRKHLFIFTLFILLCTALGVFVFISITGDYKLEQNINRVSSMINADIKPMKKWEISDHSLFIIDEENERYRISGNKYSCSYIDISPDGNSISYWEEDNSNFRLIIFNRKLKRNYIYSYKNIEAEKVYNRYWLNDSTYLFAVYEGSGEDETSGSLYPYYWSDEHEEMDIVRFYKVRLNLERIPEALDEGRTIILRKYDSLGYRYTFSPDKKQFYYFYVNSIADPGAGIVYYVDKIYKTDGFQDSKEVRSDIYYNEPVLPETSWSKEGYLLINVNNKVFKAKL